MRELSQMQPKKQGCSPVKKKLERRDDCPPVKNAKVRSPCESLERRDDVPPQPPQLVLCVVAHMLRGWPGKIIFALLAPWKSLKRIFSGFSSPALVVLGAIVLVKVSFRVKLGSTLGARELGRPGESRQVRLAPVVGARGVALLLGGGRPFSVSGRGGGDDDRLVVQVHLHLLHVLLLSPTSSSSSSSPSPTTCCIGVPLQ